MRRGRGLWHAAQISVLVTSRTAMEMVRIGRRWCVLVRALAVQYYSVFFST